MALPHLKIDKASFMFIVAVWNAIATYVGAVSINLSPPILTLVLTIGNSAIVLLGIETGNEPTDTTAATPPTPVAPKS